MDAREARQQPAEGVAARATLNVGLVLLPHEGTAAWALVARLAACVEATSAERARVPRLDDLGEVDVHAPARRRAGRPRGALRRGEELRAALHLHRGGRSREEALRHVEILGETGEAHGAVLRVSVLPLHRPVRVRPGTLQCGPAGAAPQEQPARAAARERCGRRAGRLRRRSLHAQRRGGAREWRRLQGAVHDTPPEGSRAAVAWAQDGLVARAHSGVHPRQRPRVPRPRRGDREGVRVRDERPHAVHLLGVVHVKAQYEWRGDHAPEAPVRALLVVLRRPWREVPHLAHVRVSPASRPRPRDEEVGGVDGGVGLGEDAVHAGADVPAGPEEVHGARACREVGPAVVAVLDPHGPTSRIEQVGVVGDVVGRPASVDLHAVEAHVRKPPYILFVVRLKVDLHTYAVVQVGTHLQAQRVPVLDQRLHVGEPVLPHQRLAVLTVEGALAAETQVGALGQRRVHILTRAAVAALPTVVHADVVKAELGQARVLAAHPAGLADRGVHLHPHALLRENSIIFHAVECIP
mmetsp:Transcript_78649/g.205077  ORF Transcript_78649/g.205077 Transcript_78649/m.205077 type:complete len:524 (+) Transcript_78649:522-2093(+)